MFFLVFFSFRFPLVVQMLSIAKIWFYNSLGRIHIFLFESLYPVPINKGAA